MSGYTICGVMLNVLTDKLVWRTRDTGGKYTEGSLPEGKVLWYIKKMVGLHSVDELKQLLKKQNVCSIYFGGDLMAIVDYDHLAGKFSYFQKKNCHSCDHIDDQLGLTAAQQKQMSSRKFRTVLHAVMKGDYTKISTKMDFLSFDLMALVFEKLGVQRLYLNETIVRRDIIGKMAPYMVTQHSLQSFYEKSVSSVCQGTFKEILRDRAERKEAQRHRFLADFHRINDNIELGEADYIEVVRIHFQDIMTPPNVLSILKAFKKGGVRIIKQFCELLAEAVHQKENTFEHRLLDYGSRRVLKYIFEEKYDNFQALIVENKLSFHIRFVLLMVQINCFFYDTDIKLSGDVVFDSVESFVDIEDVSPGNLRKMMEYVISELRRNKDKSNAEGKRFLYSIVAENVSVFFLNDKFVIDFLDYSMLFMSGEDTVKHWNSCKDQMIDAEDQFKHALTLSEWFCYSKVPQFPECMVSWWQEVLGETVEQWKVPTKEY